MYVTYEIVKKLKDINCELLKDVFINFETKTVELTHSEVKKWLREEKSIDVEPVPYANLFKSDMLTKDKKYTVCAYYGSFENRKFLGTYDTYELAEAAGIKEALNHLK